MTNKRINNITELDIPSLTYKNFRKKVGTGVAVLIDGYYARPRDKQYHYRHGILTEVGDIEQRLWCTVAKQLVETNGDLYHYGCQKQFLKSKDTFGLYIGLRGKENLEEDVLDHCIRELHNDPSWVYFEEYNKEHNPDLLTKTSFLEIQTVCCNLPSFINISIG